MKTKSLPHKIITKDHFFLLMIVPILIGLMITFNSMAHAEWKTLKDPLLSLTPKNQGWSLVDNKKQSSNLLKGEASNLKTASR
jgi:hypothetical protein